MVDFSFWTHKLAIRFKIYALSLTFQDEVSGCFKTILLKMHNCFKFPLMTQLQFILKFILAGLLTLIWWEITLIQWVTAFVMTRKALLLRLVSSVKFPCRPVRSSALWEARLGMACGSSESLNQNEMYKKNVWIKLHSLRTSVCE